jgi:hypothetical protein
VKIDLFKKLKVLNKNIFLILILSLIAPKHSVGGSFNFTLQGTASGFQQPPLYAFTSHTFTNCGASGMNGPSLANCVSAYSGQAWASSTSYLNMTTAGIQLWTVPKTGTFRILARGANGGSPGNGQIGGYGAAIQGDFSLNKGDVLKILVGQSGVSGNGDDSSGGGGTFVVKSDNTILVIAGGGGGSGPGSCGSKDPTIADPANSGCPESGCSAGSGGTGGAGGTVSNCSYHSSAGGGFSGNGANSNSGYGSTGGTAFLNGGTGGGSELPGGFGGGGGSHSVGGKGSGGGGYSGGGGGPGWSSGGGGSSKNNGSNQSNTAASNSGMGSVFIQAL